MVQIRNAAIGPLERSQESGKDLGVSLQSIIGLLPRDRFHRDMERSRNKKNSLRVLQNPSKMKHFSVFNYPNRFRLRLAMEISLPQDSRRHRSKRPPMIGQLQKRFMIGASIEPADLPGHFEDRDIALG